MANRRFNIRIVKRNEKKEIPIEVKEESKPRPRRLFLPRTEAEARTAWDHLFSMEVKNG